MLLFLPLTGVTVTEALSLNDLVLLETANGWRQTKLSTLRTALTDALAARVTANEASIGNKVNISTFTALQSRVSAAELSIDVLEELLEEIQLATPANWTVVTGERVLNAGGRYLVDASQGPITVHYPANPAPGAGVIVHAFGGAVQIHRNGSTIAVTGFEGEDTIDLTSGQQIALATIAGMIIQTN